jgi:hypothetical protein
MSDGFFYARFLKTFDINEDERCQNTKLGGSIFSPFINRSTEKL